MSQSLVTLELVVCFCPRLLPIYDVRYLCLAYVYSLLGIYIYIYIYSLRGFSKLLRDKIIHRSSPIYLAIHPLFIHYLPVTLSPRSSQIFYRSFKDLSKISLPPSPSTGTWTVGHSGPLFRSPSFSFPPFF